MYLAPTRDRAGHKEAQKKHVQPSKGRLFIYLEHESTLIVQIQTSPIHSNELGVVCLLNEKIKRGVPNINALMI